MRRDVWRVGVGRFALEAALGCVLAFATDADRAIAIITAMGAAVAAHFAGLRELRRAFLAAHLTMAAAVIAARLDAHLAVIAIGLGLGAAIELTNVDHVHRRRITEHVRSLRIPSSLIMRRLGSLVAVGVAGRASVAIVSDGVPAALVAVVLMLLGAVSLLGAGFAAGPGRPVTRPVDALAFVVLGALLVVPSR